MNNVKDNSAIEEVSKKKGCILVCEYCHGKFHTLDGGHKDDNKVFCCNDYFFFRYRMNKL